VKSNYNFGRRHGPDAAQFKASAFRPRHSFSYLALSLSGVLCRWIVFKG
jgi:hypothetical protein